MKHVSVASGIPVGLIFQCKAPPVGEYCQLYNANDIHAWEFDNEMLSGVIYSSKLLFLGDEKNEKEKRRKKKKKKKKLQGIKQQIDPVIPATEEYHTLIMIIYIKGVMKTKTCPRIRLLNGLLIFDLFLD